MPRKKEDEENKMSLSLCGLGKTIGRGEEGKPLGGKEPFPLNCLFLLHMVSFWVKMSVMIEMSATTFHTICTHIPTNLSPIDTGM